MKGKKTGGRTKGTKNVATIERELDLAWERELLRRQILTRRSAMTEKQMDHAEGVAYMILRKPDGTYARATDAAQVDAACAVGASAFKIFTQAPNPQAYSTLMAYAVDKPKEQAQDLNIKADVNILDILRQRHAKRKKTE